MAQWHRIFFLWMTGTDREKYQTRQFREDIDRLDPTAILELYGTHMITGINSGSRIDYLYRSIMTDRYEVYKWMSYNSSHWLDVGSQNGYPIPDGDPPLKDNIYFEMIDASGAVPNAWMIDIVNYDGDKVTFPGLGKFLEENSTMIGFSGPLVPIYELVADPVKKEALRQAFDIYLGGAD